MIQPMSKEDADFWRLRKSYTCRGKNVSDNGGHTAGEAARICLPGLFRKAKP